ncbi:hypothetical protein SASPL_145919 [Salvia splendens]|uniref:RING-type domain-containing protein n=1 Tax=Salvia splendens TaxID=180675 RepID=A0A8X8Z7S6_SALSN|nr:vacuolar protein sorting-associated protein 8 homolog [Salvia splendens]KAG6395277.1 hypothetical protein SASPL_145919 [Salvia splendens]
MEHPIAVDVEMDIDSLLQSHGGETDSDEEDRHRRTVDEILLNHSSPSSSPPSSPLRGVGDDDESDASANLRDHGLSHSHSVPLVYSHNYRYNSAANSSRANFAGRVLPPLFGNGAVRSNAKPGAALAAAAAASRSIPTPHATAIKLRRANTGVPTLQSSLSETAENFDSVASSLSAAPSEVDLCQSQEEEGVQLPLGNIDSDSTGVGGGDGDSDHGASSSEDRNQQKSNEGATLETSYDDDECAMLTNKPRHASNIQSEEDQIPVIEQVSSPSAGEENEQCAEIRAADESGDVALPSPASSGVDYGEDIIRGEEASNPENTVSESGECDYSSGHNDAAQLLEDLVSQGEDEDSYTKLQQKSDRSVKPLDLAEEIEKKQAFTGLHYEEGAAAQPMRLEGVKRGSTVLGYFDVRSDNVLTRIISSQAFRKDHGSPQVISVHLNYIAVGMSKGSIFVVPSKYTAHHVDNMDTKMIPLGLQGDRSLVPVTSMCFNQHGDILFAGYGDGHYTVWDVQKASALKVITEHRAPVVHMLYLGQDTQVTRQFNVVSGDSKGVVKLIRFTVVPWLNRISYTKPMKLLDETTSRVVCASPLLYNEGYVGSMLASQSSFTVSTSSISSMMSGMVDEGVVIFITHQSALVAKVIPTVEVYAQIPKPDGIREGSMPYAAWRCGSRSLTPSSENALVEASDKASLLAIAWDHKVQVAKLLKSELKVLEKWTLESEAVGLAWLGDQMLAILTSTAQLCLYAKDGNLIHQTSFSVDGFRGDNLISHHIYYTNSSGNPEKAYHNSVSVRGATMYILGQEHLIVCRLLSWKERIEVLRKAGDWIGALNMAMALYDGQSYGLVDLPKNLDDLQRTVMPYLAELLQAYVSEVFSYLSVACYNQNTKEDEYNEIKEQFIRVGGVAVEFCVHIRRTDILFEDIMSKFDEAHQKETFLELLEPYILKDMLGSLPPGIMQALVEHYSKRGWLQRIEQCVLHMDILSLDFNQVVRLCREHRLDCALIYLFNKGLDDFRTPLEELLLVLRDSTRENATSLGYRVLVYLKYCFQGLAFPPGHGNLSPSRVTSLRKELLEFLLEDSSAPNSWAVTSLSSGGAYANMLHLLQLDTEATLQVLKLAFVDVELSPSGQPSEEATDINMKSDDSDKLVQRVVNILAGILDAGYFMSDSPVCSTETNSVEVWPSKEDVGHMYDFIAYYVAYGKATVSKDILSQIIQYLTSEVNISDTLSEKVTDIFRRREKQLLSLIQVVPGTQWDAPYLLHLSEKAQFHKVCGYIHAISHQLVAAMDSYIKAIQEPVYAFSFIYEMLRLLDGEESDAFESAVISRIPYLVKLSREATYFLITDHFSGRTAYILSDLRSHPESLFLYLKTVIEVQTTGAIDISCLQDVDTFDYPSPTNSKLQSNGVQAYLEAISTSLKLLHNNLVNVTDEMMELYFELLCRFDRKSVLKFLETSESYRVEHCLSLCQEYGITDAASFLLERVGEVRSALLLILSHLSEKFVMLDEEIQRAISCPVVDNLNAFLKKKVVAEILDIVRACIGLCQRNSPRLQPEESESLWFQLLDSFCEPLIDSGNAREALKDSSTGSVNPEEEAQTFKWKVSKYGKCAHMARKLFSIFIKEIVEGMIGYVRLPRIMLKLLSENGNQEFGDFKLTILGILGRYDFERRILDTAKSLIEDDTYYTMSLLMKGASHGYAPRSLVCCICSSVLAKNTLDSSIQVYSCGHATHLHCQLEGNRASFSGTLVGCPICTPGSKARKSSGMHKLAENGLVSSSPSSMQQPRSTPLLHLHDHEFGDNSFGSHPSRFELLHNLEGDHKLIQMENTPQLKLAPPALYHEKLKKGIDNSSGGSTSRVSTTEKTNSKQLRDVKLKGSSSVRFPLKSNIIFGKEKIRKR